MGSLAPLTPSLPGTSRTTLGISRVMAHPAMAVPATQWTDEAFVVQEACGLKWDWADILRFLKYVARDGNCLMWTGAKSRGKGNQQWYGSFYAKGKTVRAHKFSGVAILGLRPEAGQDIDHSCHRTGCISCLRTLTKAQNQALIRRPNKRHLDLARFLEITPAELMLFNEEQIASFENLMQLAKSRETHRPLLLQIEDFDNFRVPAELLAYKRRPH